MKWISVTNGFVKEHTNILFTRADKGNITVAMDKDEYTRKMELMLADSKTYALVDGDPCKKIISDKKQLLNRWKDKLFIGEQTYKNLTGSEGLLPRAYGLPKVHKEGCPLRVIVSSINSPLYSLASYLHKILHDNIKTATSYIKNSLHLVRELRNFHVEPNYHLCSLDVVSLFTNVPIELSIESILKRWNDISVGTSIPKDEFIIGIKLVLNSTFFKFNERTYRQIFGTPMGSPLSPIIADIVMQDLEERAVMSLPFELPLYMRYVDDILCAIPLHQAEFVLNAFNSLHHRLQFTMEINNKNFINFLDVTIIADNDKLTFDWFHKDTYSGRYLNFNSHHPLAHKRGVIYGLVDKVFQITSPIFHKKNLECVIRILLDNSYPLSFIFSNINNRVKHHIFQKTNTANTTDDENVGFFTVPFVKNISDKFTNIVKDYNIKMSYSSVANLRSFITTGKDKLKTLDHNGVVYQICCKDCQYSYIGQTKRLLKTRIKEHKSDINKRSGAPSVISAHRLEQDHEFDWDNVKILDRERSYTKRLTSEMVNIAKFPMTLNKQTDTEFLSPEYLPLIKKY